MAPIIIFAYARHEHLRLAVQALQLNAECVSSPLYVFCDGPASEEISVQTNLVRAFVDSIQGFKSVSRFYSDVNLGLSQSIIRGVTHVLTHHEDVIVIEDDLVVSPYFLAYMNQSLSLYRDEPRVASIHGYCYPVESELPETFFLRGADCWGWATWARAWRCFEPDGQKLLSELKERGLTHQFDFDGGYSFSGMLRNQIHGRNDSWAVRWHATCFLLDLLTLYPGKSLVNNIGNDGSGTHSAPTKVFDQTIALQGVRPLRIAIEESYIARRAFIAYFRSQHSLLQRVLRKLNTLVKKGRVCRHST